jgi:predicted Zn-dependent protease
MRFPPEWTVSNSAQQVVARAPNADLFMMLQLEQQVQGRNIEQIALTSMQKRGLEPLEGGRTEVNGLDAYIATYRGQLQNVGTVGVRGAHIVHENRVYLLVGLAAANAYSSAAETFTRSMRTFRPLSRAEASDIHPNRVDLYVVRQGDTWASIAARADNLVKPSTLAIMNDHAVDEPPRAGQRIKIVVTG